MFSGDIVVLNYILDFNVNVFQAHKEARPFQNKRFPQFEDLTIICAKDREMWNGSLTVQEELAEPETENTQVHQDETDHEASTPNEGYTIGCGNNKSPVNNACTSEA